jgi:serine protease Do
MNKRTLLIGGALAALSVGLIALPSRSATQCPEQDEAAKLEEKLQNLQSRLDSVQVSARTQQAAARALARLQDVERLPELQDLTVMLDGEEASWLGVETQEVSADFAKEHKLPGERGVILGKVISDSPAAKAGLKENDVVTEVNGQRVEGTAQFRRMIREIPAGRTVQLGIVRDGRSQNVSVTLGKSEQARRVFKAPAAPGTYSFRMPDLPEVMELPQMEWGRGLLLEGRPRLGIDAEDLSGALGNFFGAPDGEGILVRDVNSGSPAEKAGLKAGDVITAIDGARIRTTGELREKLAAKKGDEKGVSVELSVMRNKSTLSITVQLPAPSQKVKRTIGHRTNI